MTGLADVDVKLFIQVCVWLGFPPLTLSVLETSLPMQRSHDTLALDINSPQLHQNLVVTSVLID